MTLFDSLNYIPDIVEKDSFGIKEPPLPTKAETLILNNCNSFSIYEEAVRRNIKYLYHFTDVRNIPMILKNGLLPRNKIDYNFYVNDTNRLDRTGGVCCSISFPNYKMFYNIRTSRYPERQYCVIVLDALNILCNYHCYFFLVNASSQSMHSLYEVKNSVKDFKKLFGDEISRKCRCLKDNETTDVQAEIIITDNIPVECILGIAFENQNETIEAQRELKHFDGKIFFTDSNLFFPRHDYKYDHTNIDSLHDNDTSDEIEHLYNELYGDK